MTWTRGVGERMLIQCGDHRVRGEQVRHLGIEIHQRDVFHGWIFQDFADGQAVAAAQHQDAVRARKRRETRMD